MGGRRIAIVACWIGRGSRCWRWSRGGLSGRRHIGLVVERNVRGCRGRDWWWLGGNNSQGFGGRNLPWLRKGIQISVWLVVFACGFGIMTGCGIW